MRQAIEFGSAPWMPGAEHSSEDCLSLNVWRPADAEAGLPVYVWLSGGGNQIQMPRISDTPGHLGASRSRVVFVSISYRVGEMGWLSHPALRDGDPLDGSGNDGTLDIIKGLEWVRDNIDAFDGDPGNVLLTGESAGAHNTLTLLISPAARGLFHKVMAESGRTDTSPVERGNERGEGILERLLTQEHGGEAGGVRARREMTAPDIAGFLRTRSPEQMAVAARGLFLAGFTDGVVLSADGFASLDDGTYPNKVPAIVGMNQEEAKSLPIMGIAMTDSRIPSAQRSGARMLTLVKNMDVTTAGPNEVHYLSSGSFGWEERFRLPSIPDRVSVGSSDGQTHLTCSDREATMRIAKTALGVAVLGSLLFSGASAFGATAPAGGAIQVWGTPANNGGGPVVITGAIADGGKSMSVNASGKPDKKGNYKLLELKKGNILLNGTQINTALNNASPTAFNTTTCSGAFTATAAVPIVSGTKAYTGISGTVNITVIFAIVLPLTKGTCNENTNANPIAQYGSISGTGTVSFG